jgi:hypothetical protein
VAVQAVLLRVVWYIVPLAIAICGLATVSVGNATFINDCRMGTSAAAYLTVGPVSATTDSFRADGITQQSPDCADYDTSDTLKSNGASRPDRLDAHPGESAGTASFDLLRDGRSVPSATAGLTLTRAAVART